MNNTKKWEVIYADFPWPYTSFGTAKLPYGTMSAEQIAEFPWDKLMAKRCIIFVWFTCPLLMGTQRKIVNEWERRHGLTFQGVPYVWVKTRKDGKPLGATGPRPRLVKPVVEFVLAFSNVKKGRPLPLFTEKQEQVVMAPRGAHSAKPHEVRRRITALLGDVAKLELFSREAAAGWDGWGDQYPGNSPLPDVL